MPNNFRLTGSRYVSKAGHDSNDGISPGTPKRSVPPTITSGTTVVGAGTYSGQTFNHSAISTIVCDGTVHFVSCVVGANRLEFAIIKDSIINVQGSAQAWTRCLLQDCTHNAGVVDYDNCILINYSQTVVLRILRDGIAISANLAITGVTANINKVANMYFDFASKCIVTTSAFSPSTFFNNNVQGVIVLGGVNYAIKDQLIGSPQDNGYAADVFWLTEANLTANGYTGTITGWDAAVATCINRDPRFNDASKMDFTLKADSPHIGRASDGVSNIGGTSYAQSFYAGGSNPNILLLQPSAEIDTTSNMMDWKLKPGEVEGTIRAIVKVANTDEVITKLPYIGNFAFNSDSTPGTPTNFNVPDSKPSTNNYPAFLLTTGVASDTLRVVIADHGYNAGVWLKVDGQYREVTSVTQNELIFTTAVRAIVGTGVSVQVGTESELASLNPNRLNVLMRSSKSSDVNSGNWDNAMTWDNDGLAPSGQYLAQEWGSQPLIDNLNQVGFGDDNFDTNYGNPIQLKVVDLLIFLRNNYRS